MSLLQAFLYALALVAVQFLFRDLVVSALGGVSMNLYRAEQRAREGMFKAATQAIAALGHAEEAQAAERHVNKSLTATLCALVEAMDGKVTISRRALEHYRRGQLLITNDPVNNIVTVEVMDAPKGEAN